MSVDTFYLINLERRPERKEHFMKECQREGLPSDKICIFKAIDGNKPIDSPYLHLFNNCDFKRIRSYNNLVGNQLSHFLILKDIVEKKRELSVIFQDDVMLCKDFSSKLTDVVREIPAGTEIIWLGFHKEAYMSHFEPWPINEDYEIDYIKEYVTPHIGRIGYPNPCSLAYIVTLEGARNLVEYFEKEGFKRATDGNYNDYLRVRDNSYCSKYVLCTGNNIFRSDVFV